MSHLAWTHVDHGLEDTGGVVHHGLGVRQVVRAGQHQPREVGLEQEAGLGVGGVHGVDVDLERTLLGQFCIDIILVVSNRKLTELRGVHQCL